METFAYFFDRYRTEIQSCTQTLLGVVEYVSVAALVISVAAAFFSIIMGGFFGGFLYVGASIAAMASFDCKTTATNLKEMIINPRHWSNIYASSPNPLTNLFQKINISSRNTFFLSPLFRTFTSSII